MDFPGLEPGRKPFKSIPQLPKRTAAGNKNKRRKVPAAEAQIFKKEENQSTELGIQDSNLCITESNSVAFPLGEYPKSKLSVNMRIFFSDDGSIIYQMGNVIFLSALFLAASVNFRLAESSEAARSF